MRDILIVGAGVAGLICAAIARSKGCSVTVIEASSHVGGAWKSRDVVLNGQPYVVDDGLRLPVTSGVADVDNSIFYRSDFEFDWCGFDGWPREGAITNGHFNPESSCIDARKLGLLRTEIANELKSMESLQHAHNAKEYSVRWYGDTITELLVRGVVERSYGEKLESLASSAVKSLIPKRVIMGDPQETAILLQDEILRGRIAHARYQDLPLGAHPNYIRPKNGGISTWINSLYNSLNNDGVIFIFNEKIKDLDVSGGIVNKINLSSGISLNPYSIICTIPVLLLSRYFGIVGEKPEFRDLLITHIAIDKNVSHSCQYVLNFNKEGKFYRAIFHQNIPGGEASAGVVTLEHLVDDVTNVTELALEAIHECAETGLIENTTNISQCNYLHRNSVPVPTVAYNSHSAKVSQQVCSKAKNIVFTGRASGSLFLKSIIDDAVFLIDQQIKGI